MWIHEQKGWPNFSTLLVQTRHQQGHLLGWMEAMGFSIRQEVSLDTLTIDVVTSSAIERESLVWMKNAPLLH